MRYFSQSLSYAFHPFLMPLYGLLCLFYLPTLPVTYNRLDALYFFPEEAKAIFLIVLAVLTFVAPAISLLIMRMNGMITSLHLEDRSERIYPFSLVTFYFILAYIYVRYQIPIELMHPALLGFLFGMLVTLLIGFIINFSGLKVSLHAVGVFGVTGGVLGYMQTQLPYFQTEQFANLSVVMILFVISGLVCSARVYLKAHTLSEVIVGTFLGFTCLFICVKFGLFI